MSNETLVVLQDSLDPGCMQYIAKHNPNETSTRVGGQPEILSLFGKTNTGCTQRCMEQITTRTKTPPDVQPQFQSQRLKSSVDSLSIQLTNHNPKETFSRLPQQPYTRLLVPRQYQVISPQSTRVAVATNSFCSTPLRKTEPKSLIISHL